MAARTVAGVLTYGVDRGDVRAEGVVLDDHLRPRFDLVTPWGDAEVALAVRGRHNAENAAGRGGRRPGGGRRLRRRGRRPGVGVVVALADGADRDAQRAAGAQRRLQRQPHVDGRGPRGPRRPGRRAPHRGARSRWPSSGPTRPTEHSRIGELAARLGIRLLAVDTHAYGSAAERVAGIDERRRGARPVGPRGRRAGQGQPGRRPGAASPAPPRRLRPGGGPAVRVGSLVNR